MSELSNYKTEPTRCAAGVPASESTDERCKATAEPGEVFCPPHAKEARQHWEADRYGWGIPA